VSTWWALAAAADDQDTAAVGATALPYANTATRLDGSLPFFQIIQRCRMLVCGYAMGATLPS